MLVVKINYLIKPTIVYSHHEKMVQDNLIEDLQKKATQATSGNIV